MGKFGKIYLVGNGRVADDCLKELHNRKVTVTYIEIFPEKFSFTKKLCERCDIEFCHIDKKDFKDFLMKTDVETLIISAHNSYIFPKEVVEKRNLTIINLHIAYLPKYRGMNPPTWAIYNGESYSGATWHEVGSGIDNGGIIIQRKVQVMEDDTAMKLMLRCFQEGVNLFKENLDVFLKKSYCVTMPEKSNTKLYLSKELPNDGFIDFGWGFDKSYAFLRSMDYSGANLMPLPKIEYDGIIYNISRYQKEITPDAETDIKVSISCIGNDIIKLSWGKESLICWLRTLEI